MNYPAETTERVIREIRANPLMGVKVTELIIKQIEDDTIVGQQFIKEYLGIEKRNHVMVSE